MDGTEAQTKITSAQEPTDKSVVDGGRLKLAAEDASAQLDSVLKSRGTGVCYDGQRGCLAGNSLGVIKIVGVPRGSASIAQVTLEKMKAVPALRALLADEERAKSALLQTRENARLKEVALDMARSPAEKSKLQLDVRIARQAESNAKSKFDTLQVKVEEEAKRFTVILE